MQALASVYDIPKDYYAAKIATIAYAEINGDTIYSECENNNAIAMADVALYETNNENSALSAAQLKALKDDYLTYTLTLHDQNGAVTGEPDRIIYGEKTQIADAAHRNGYKFDGWYNHDYTQQWINGTTSALGDTLLYAKYSEAIELKNEYDVYIKGQTVEIADTYYGDGSQNVSCEIFDGDGNRVSIENGKFKALSAGTYKAVYTCGTERLEQSINVIGNISDGAIGWTESLKNSLVKSLDGKGSGGENGAYPANVSLVKEKGKNALKVQYNENFPGKASDSSTYDKSSYPGIELGDLIDNAVTLTSSSVVSFYVKLSDNFWGQQTGGIFITYNGVDCSTMSSDNGKYGINSFVSRISAEIDGTGEFIKSSNEGNLLWTERNVCGVKGKAYLMQLAMDGANYDSPQWVKVTLKFSGISNPSLKGLRILYSSRNGVMYNRNQNGSMLAEITAKDAIYISDFEIASK